MRYAAIFLLPLFLLASCDSQPPQVEKKPLPPAKPHVEARLEQIPEPRETIVPPSKPPTPARTPKGVFVPEKAKLYAPLLAKEQRSVWPDAPKGWTLGGLVEQETCNSLTSRGCWNPHEELKTYREYGFGLGQVTIAYNPDGSERFNEFNELKRKYAPLSQWKWSDRYEPSYQLIAIVEMNLALWKKVPPAADDDTQWAFTLVSYNGGLGSLLQDRRLCANSSGCDPTKWFGNIETHSLKSKAPQKAYGGQSWYSITRSYVRNVLITRRPKYQQFWG